MFYKQVEGILIATNPYSTPFEPVCAICNSPVNSSIAIANATIFCSQCNDNFPFLYKHCINAVIESITNNFVQCIIREPLLHDLLPDLKSMSYETYLQQKATTVYILRDFKIQSKFTLNEDSELLHVN